MRELSEKRGSWLLASLALACWCGSLMGCGAPGAMSASGTQVEPAALNTAQQQVDRENPPAELRPYYFALYSEGRQNSVLHAMQGGLVAIRIGRFDLAEPLFDQAIREVEAMQEGAEQAKRARSNFVAEKEKWFKGESHERAALYVYRGLLYLRNGDYNNASACFKRAELQDITAEDKKDFAGDWYSAEMGLALADFKNGRADEAQTALARAATFKSRQGNVSLPSASTGRLIVVEVGTGPVKFRSGRYGEQLRFREVRTPIQRIEVVDGESAVLTSAAAENLFFQATTRGGRQVDHILVGKAEFKEDTGNAAVGLAGAAAVASQTERSGIAAGVLALASIGTMIASASSNPAADIRSWDELPHSLFFLNVPEAASSNSLTIKALDRSAQTVQTVSLPALDAGRKGLEVTFIRIP